MKAIGIDAIVLDDDCNVTKKESILIKAILNENGDIVCQDVLNLETVKEIQEFDELQDFLDNVLHTAENEFGKDFNSFEISGINEQNKYTWNIKCIKDENDCFYTFNDLTNMNIEFVETK